VAASSLRILLGCADCDLIEWVDSGVQMTLGQVQIERGVFQALMAHQQLDGVMSDN
jgi:hypothetical protein